MLSVLSCPVLSCPVLSCPVLYLLCHSIQHSHFIHALHDPLPFLTRLSVASITLQIKVERQIKFIVFVLTKVIEYLTRASFENTVVGIVAPIEEHLLLNFQLQSLPFRLCS